MSNIRKNEISASLCIYGPTSKEEVGELINLENSNFKKKGEFANDENTYKVGVDRWCYCSDLSKNSSIEDHITYILNKLNPYSSLIVDLSKKYDVQISFGIYYYDFSAGIFITKENSKRLSELNVDIDFDMYYLGKDDDE